MNERSTSKLAVIPYFSQLRRLIPAQWKKHALSIFYYGRTVHCPFCSRNFRHFLPSGVVSRPNSQCPFCGSVERYRLLYLYLKNKTQFFSKCLKVLDVGPDRSFSKFCTSLSNIQYVSTDLFHKIAMTKMDLTKLAFKKESFDYITCFHVLEHIKDDMSAMRELFRVLKPEGHALIQVPIDINRAKAFEASNISEKDYEAVYGQFDHVRIYGLDFQQKLEKAGFSVKIEPYIDDLDKKIIRRYALKRSYRIKLYETNDDIYDCSK